MQWNDPHEALAGCREERIDRIRPISNSMSIVAFEICFEKNLFMIH